MNYIDKLTNWVIHNGKAPKPETEDFWYWLNNYSPKEDNLEFVKLDKTVYVGYEIWKKPNFPNMDYYFMYREWTGHFMPINIVDQNHLQISSDINKKATQRFQCRGTERKWTNSDSMRQFNIFINK